MSQKNDLQLAQDIAKLSVTINQGLFVMCDRITRQAAELNQKISHLDEHRDIQPSYDVIDILETLPVAILILNQQGIVAKSNQQAKQLLGSNIDQKYWHDIVTQKFIAGTDQLGRTRLQSGQIIHISTQALAHQPGQMIALTDVTKDSELEQRLEHMQRLGAMGQMAASLAHQIRTPLSAAMLYANHLTTDNLAEEKRDKFTQKIIARLHHIEAQIKEMLAYAKGGTTQIETAELNDLLRAIEQGAEAAIEQSQSKLTVELSKHTLLLKCNSDAIVSAIHNCIMNAIEAAEASAVIDVYCEYEKDFLSIVVADQSGGIPEHLQQQVLQPFFTTRSKGTGLGLAVAKVVCETLGGELWIKSTPGYGTQIGFKLPVLQGEE